MNPSTLESLEKEIKDIKARNKRVEEDKKWKQVGWEKQV